MKNCLKICSTVLLAVCIVRSAFGQEDSTIHIPRKGNTFGMRPVPVSIEGFTGEVAEAIKWDLYVQGYSFVPSTEAQYVIKGSNNGSINGSVTDRYAKKELLSRTYAGGRAGAHLFTEDIVEAITGKPGISALRGATAKIAFKVQPNGIGPGEIYVSDFDGHYPQTATSDKAIVAAPTWAPGKMALCYNSYALEDSPYIFYHDISTGQRKVIARYGGSCISPSVSPDGTKVAMILSKNSNRPNVYVANIDGSGLRQLTTETEDSSPCWSPDGMWIYFATKVSERRTLARVSIAGGDIQKIPTTGAPNPSEPDISPDGKWIAFTSQSSSYFNICVVPIEGGTPVVVAAGEDPSWAPNSRTLVCAKRTNERYTLSVLDVFTKQFKDIARISGSDSEPAWAK